MFPLRNAPGSFALYLDPVQVAISEATLQMRLPDSDSSSPFTSLLTKNLWSCLKTQEEMQKAIYAQCNIKASLEHLIGGGNNTRSEADRYPDAPCPPT